MTVKLQKVGNSHMITIPQKIMVEAGFRIGEKLKVIYQEGEVLIVKDNQSKNKKLTDLLGRISLDTEEKITQQAIQKLLDVRYEDR